MSKINFRKVGNWLFEILKNNSSTIAGGLSMIGLALLCRKLNIPYQVLTDPFDIPQNGSNNLGKAAMLYMPNDATEASIAAIYNNALTLSYDFQKTDAAKEIYSILVKRKDDISQTTVTYAINALRMLADDMTYGHSKNDVMRLISKIGKGEF